jgi:hypothetical protein
MRMKKILIYWVFLSFLIFYGCALNNPFQANTYSESDPDTKPEQTPTPEPTPPVVKWAAYNDCLQSDSGNAPNVTEFNYTNTTGTLIHYSDGIPTSVTVHISGSNVAKWIGGMPAQGTDAYSLFNGILNLNESAAYYDGIHDWYCEITFTGLDPSTEYEFITTVNRDDISFGGDGLTSRWTKFTISGADTYSNISSTGVTQVSESIVKMNTGYNTENGYIVGWTGITAADGTFTVHSENVGEDGPGEPYKSYGFQGFVLKEFE